VTWLHVGKRERDRIACFLMIAQRVSTSLKRWNRFLKNSAQLVAGGAFKDCLDVCYPEPWGNDPSNGNGNPDMT